jgi:hypothetical protein
MWLRVQHRFSGEAAGEEGMQLAPILALALVKIVSPAADPAPKIEACLSAHEMREAVAEHRAVQPLVALRAAGVDEKIRAQLCKTEKDGLVYLITALAHDGHVSRIFVDASTGLRLGAR